MHSGHGQHMDDATSEEHTPRGSWHPHIDYRIMLSIDGYSCTSVSDYDNIIRQSSVTPKHAPHFEDLTLPDIERLEELPGASGRRRSKTYRFGHDSVIKVSPHRNLLYEARMLAYIKQKLPYIPVPEVYGVRQLRDASGGDRYFILMEYIDGIGADEAACEWSPEETQIFMDSVQTLRDALAKTTGRYIQAVDTRLDTNAGCEMSDGDANIRTARPIPNSTEEDLSVQDELFDHIWQKMERGPFADEAGFMSSIGVALQRRGAGAPRLDLVSRMVDHLPKTCPTGRGAFPLQHANLSLGNFLVRRTSRSADGGGTPEIIGVLGWGQCGFYPAWWELAKTAAYEDQLLVDIAAQDDAFSQYSQHASVMLHVRDIIY